MTITLTELEEFISKYHAEIWAAASNEDSRIAYDDAGRELSKEFLRKIESRSLSQQAVPDGWKLADQTALEAALEATQAAIMDAYSNAYPVCCERGGHECCGSPEPEWSEADQKIMAALQPVQTILSAILSGSPIDDGKQGGDETNKKLAYQILFNDPETGEELRPDGLPDCDDGRLVIVARNRAGSRKWMHTIHTEEL